MSSVQNLIAVVSNLEAMVSNLLKPLGPPFEKNIDSKCLGMVEFEVSSALARLNDHSISHGG